MRSSIFFLLILLVEGSLGFALNGPSHFGPSSEIENPIVVAQKQNGALAKALASKDKDTIAKLFVKTTNDNSGIEKLISQFQGVTISVVEAAYKGSEGVNAMLKLEKGNSKMAAFWYLVREDSSPTGWQIGGVGKSSGAARKFDFSDVIWCWSDFLRCIGNTMSLIFG